MSMDDGDFDDVMSELADDLADAPVSEDVDGPDPEDDYVDEGPVTFDDDDDEEDYDDDEDDDDVEGDAEEEDEKPAPKKRAKKEKPEEKEEEEDGDDGDESLGTAEKPLSHKHLSENRMIELQLDGERVVVSEKELASGYLREQVFHRRMNDIHLRQKSADKQVEVANERIETIRRNTIDLLSNAEQLDEYMERNLPDVWEEAMRIGIDRIIRLEEAGPEARMRYMRERDNARFQARLDRERKARERLETAEKRKVAGEKAVAALKVPFATVMAELGNPTIPKEAQPNFWPTLARALDAAAHVKKGGLTRAEVEDVIRYQVSRVIARQPKGQAASAGAGPMAGSQPQSKGSPRARRGKRRGKSRKKSDDDWIFRA